MNQVKKAFKRVIAGNDAIQNVFYGNPSNQTFQDAIKAFSLMSHNDKETLIGRCFKKLSKQKQPKEILSILHLLLKISTIPKSSFYHQISTRFQMQQLNINIEQKQQNDKIRVAQNNLCKFYYKFLQLYLTHTSGKIQSVELSNLSDSLQNSEVGVSMIVLILQFEFIIGYCIDQNSKNNKSFDLNFDNLITIICKHIICQASDQYNYALAFIKKWSYVILQDNDHSVAINEIYEKLIYIDKNLRKLTNLCKKLQIPSKFTKFPFDNKLNSDIENKMLGKKQERIAFITQKNIKSKKLICNQNNNNSDKYIIDQQDIFLNYDE